MTLISIAAAAAAMTLRAPLPMTLRAPMPTRTAPAQCTETLEFVDWDARWREYQRQMPDAAERQMPDAAEPQVTYEAYLRRLKASRELPNRNTPRGHGDYVALYGLPRGVQPISASALTEPATDGLLGSIAAIRVDHFLLALLAGGALLFFSGMPAAAATPEALPATGNGLGGAVDWLVQNAALETAWLASLAS